MLGITLGGDAGADAGDDPAAFMKAYNMTYKILLKGDQMSELYNVTMLPTLYLVGDEGEIIHAEYGLREGAKEDLERIIAGCLRRHDR